MVLLFDGLSLFQDWISSAFTHSLHDDLPVPGAVIKIRQHNLLPGSQRWLTIDERHTQRRLKQSCQQMRKSVAIMPGLVMMVTDSTWSKLLAQLRQILQQTRFILNGCNSRSRSGYENRE